MTVSINSAEYTEAGWFVVATVENEDGTRCGSHQLDLPESATVERIKSAIAELHGCGVDAGPASDAKQ